MTNIVNLGALLLALALSLLAAAGGGVLRTGSGGQADKPEFHRIVSLGITTDAALAELCEPARVVGVSAWSTGPTARRWTGTTRLRGLDDLEAVLALAPDLVLVNSVGGDGDRLARLRQAGVRVEVLGPMAGLAAYADDLARVGDLLGRGAEARGLGQRLQQRLSLLAASRPHGPRALYLATYDGTLFGGTVGTSYHDVLTGAGCVDAAAGSYRGWPQFGVEQVLALAPAVVLTKAGMELRISQLLAALPQPARIIALPGELLEDPGPRVLEAAEVLAAQLDAPPAGLPAGDPGTATSR
jgi:iron complex transport system substrate-binding protein